MRKQYNFALEYYVLSSRIMDQVEEFVQGIRGFGIELFVNDNKLKIRGAEEILTESTLSFIRDNKQNIIEFLQSQKDITYNLSYGQLSLWASHKLAPQSSAYNISCIVETKSSFNLEVFQRSVKLIINRHPILRTVYHLKQNHPLQKILNDIAIPINIEESHNLNLSDLDSWIKCRSEASFDLESGPMIRICYLKNIKHGVQTQHILLFVLHHIAFDMISLNVFLSELSIIYSALLLNKKILLPTLNCTYHQYSEQQKKILASPIGQKMLNYWMEELKGELSPLLLPTIKPRPPVQTYLGDSFSSKINHTLWHKIIGYCRSQSITPYVFMLTAYYIFLYRYTGQSDIIVGTPSSGRDSQETQNMIGYFANVLALRNSLSGQETFEDILKKTQGLTKRALENAHIPFPYLIEMLRPKNDPAFHLIFNVMFNWNQSSKLLDNLLGDSNEFISGLRLGNNGGFSHDIILNVVDETEQYEIVWTFNTDLFDKKVIVGMHEHYVNIIEAIVNNPSIVIDTINLLSESEIKVIETEWNQQRSTNDVTYFGLHQIFEEQAEKHSQAIALVFQDEFISYQVLNERSNQFAHYLMMKGINNESLVVITMDRSIEQIIAILGVLKTGAAYVPVVPSYPKQRINILLNSIKPSFVISQKIYRALYENEEVDYSKIFLDANNDDFYKNQPITNPEAPLKEKSLAYVIFTSGSTGKPKGVSIEHRSVINTITSVNNLFNITESSSVLGLSAINFDLSVFDIFGVFAAGGKLVLLPEEYTKDPGYWIKLIQDQNITVWNTVPALMQMMVEYIQTSANDLSSALHSFRTIMLSGDWIPLSLPEKIQLYTHPACALYSLGGATEASIWSIYYSIKYVDTKWKSIPYGKALPNQSFYVLNESLQHCPIGVVGDLFIGGAGLARNYFNDIEKTNSHFIFHPTLKQRLYKTGDMGRYFENGNIEFMGRKDNQVKLMGFRIELGEIESTLSKHPSVTRAIAIIREDIPGQKYIAAYIETIDGDEKLLAEKLIHHCSLHLPNYMIPTQIVVLNAIPLTTTGKVDIKNLPRPLSASNISCGLSELSFTEKRLFDIWISILNHESFGINDSFFLVGGNSLLVIAMHNSIENSFNTKIAMAQIFSSPTIKSLAQVLDTTKPATVLEDSKKRFSKVTKRTGKLKPEKSII